MKKHKLIIIAKILIVAPILIFALGYITMSLWNWLLPSLFNGPTINLWQTFGLVLLLLITVGNGGFFYYSLMHFRRTQLREQ